MVRNSEDFQGFAITDSNHKQWPSFEKVSYSPKPRGERDVDIEIECCGVCGSDIHSTAGRWRTRHFPLVPGHEIVGRVVSLGEDVVKGFEIGQRVGVGPLAWTCGECERCKTGYTGYCFKGIGTYNHLYPDQYVSKGGFASHIRVHENSVFEIPNNIPSEVAAPLLCAGIAAFAPLHENNVGKSSKIGILGIGGVGSMAVIFGKYFGAEVFAFDKDNSKKDAIISELKPDHFISIKDDDPKKWSHEWGNQLDLLLLASSSFEGVNFDDLVRVVKFRGKIITLAEPPADEAFDIKPFTLLGCSLEVGAVGSLQQVRSMLKIVSDNQLKFSIETLPLNENNLKTAFERMDSCDVKFKITMIGFQDQFK